MSKKRMLEYRDGKFFINSSSIEIINTCRRKAYYALKRNLRGEDESEALTFGKAIHAAMEAFYKSEKRDLNEIIDAFTVVAAPLAHVPNTEKRSIANGIKILEKYFSVYQDDPWVAFCDEKGPFVERSFEFGYRGNFIHGTIDAVLKNTDTGELVVCDHKTATSLSDLGKRAKPNTQFSIYVLALQDMGYPVTRMMVNGIQVAKTKTEFVRIFTDRTASDMEELFDTIDAAIDDYSRSLSKDNWPMNTASCAHYGGCQYLDICSLNNNLREIAISQIYSSLSE